MKQAPPCSPPVLPCLPPHAGAPPPHPAVWFTPSVSAPPVPPPAPHSFTRKAIPQTTTTTTWLVAIRQRRLCPTACLPRRRRRPRLTTLPHRRPSTAWLDRFLRQSRALGSRLRRRVPFPFTASALHLHNTTTPPPWQTSPLTPAAPELGVQVLQVSLWSCLGPVQQVQLWGIPASVLGFSPLLPLECRFGQIMSRRHSREILGSLLLPSPQMDLCSLRSPPVLPVLNPVLRQRQSFVDPSPPLWQTDLLVPFVVPPVGCGVPGRTAAEGPTA